jgi:glycosyltransferase involved in cell wall biosynthesis
LRFLLVIDHLGAGGAQRQVVNLACGLSKNGHYVGLFVYFPEFNFFRDIIEVNSITIHQYKKSTGFSLKVLRYLASLIKSGSYDFVVSYLDRPNIYAELACMVRKDSILVVSERTNYVDDKSIVWRYAKRVLHGLADHIVTNSYSQAEWLKKKYWLRSKVTCIYNGIDLSIFDTRSPISGRSDRLRLIGVGRVGPEKNIINLMMALKILVFEGGMEIEVDWVGRRDTSYDGIRYGEELDRFLEATPCVQKWWRWLGERTDVHQLLFHYDALILPSFYEGLPNVVCEAFAAGRPVLVSNVCDHPLLIGNGERGFMFDPLDPISIADAIKELADLNQQKTQVMSLNARRYAEESLSLERMIADYELLFSSLLADKRKNVSKS